MMCDLIDLNSPDVKGLLDAAKLASPLIPVPKTAEANEANSLTAEKCENANSNPFDRVLNETTEYISKKGDPFEMMLQQALKFKDRRNLKVQSVDFTDDFTPKRKKRYLKTMNKTLNALDESLMRDKSCRKLTLEIKEESISHHRKDANNVCNSNIMENVPILDNHNTLVIGSDPLELSILNQSAMNDTLLEPASKMKENDEISSFENDTLFKEFALPQNTNIKSINLRRSLSQGDKSPMKLPCLNRRLQSATDDRRRISYSEISTVLSLDRGFLDSKQSEQSIFSTLSNVSSLTKPSSISTSSLISLNNTMNEAFLNSGSLKINQEEINTTESSLGMKTKQYDLSDLAERLNKLKCTMNTISNITDDSNCPEEDNNKQITNDKLIDVDVFVVEQHSNKDQNKSSISTNSSDSVFTDINKFDKSILNEAKVLARTFEELALKTDSGSSTDDLISNNTLWMSELLPAFEDEPVVDNLIELPVSPEGNSKGTIKDDKKDISINVNNAKENSLKKMASQFIDCVPMVEQTVVSSLLADLKKLLKAENNTEINKLIDNLEIALGTNCKNNTELLITCLNISNELQSPEKSNVAENSEKMNIDKSRNESGKISSEGEINNSEKSLSDMTHKLENTSQAVTSASNADNASGQASLCKNNNGNSNDIDAKLSTSYTEEHDKSDEKLAMELLMNLGKLLRGQAEDDVTMQLLKNIGKTLNVASNVYKFENEQQTNWDKKHPPDNIHQITSLKTAESDCVTHLASTTQRRSFNSRSKTFEKATRRSVSTIDTPTRNMPNTQRKCKGISDVENRKKRFSSDPESVNLASKKVAIPEVSKRKAETEHVLAKEKPIAIGDVKSKLKKNSTIINKKGPMKAVHPINNIQRGASLGKQTALFSDIITPPKSDKITYSGSKIMSSTPNSIENNYCMPKKSARSKPMASSTPDAQNDKALSTQSTCANKNRNLSCDISPVTMYANTNDNDERKDSPKRLSRLPTPKRNTTPKRQETDTFRTSKYSTPSRHNSSFTVNPQPLSESPQRLNRSLATSRRYSPVCQKKSEKTQQSPLKESNRVIAKVKPFKLISKLKRHSNGDFNEKENNWA